MTLPTISEAKQQARALRTRAAEEGDRISHADALERVARRHGYKDWNTFLAAIGNGPPAAWTKGGRVTGRYLSHPFSGTVIDIQDLGRSWFRLAIALDAAIDVVASNGFSNLRKQIRGDVGPAGETRERTSDGVPHLVLDMT